MDIKTNLSLAEHWQRLSGSWILALNVTFCQFQSNVKTMYSNSAQLSITAKATRKQLQLHEPSLDTFSIIPFPI